MSDPEPPQGLEILPEGGADFASVQESIVERGPSGGSRAAVFVLLAVGLVAAGAFVAWVRGDDGSDGPAAEAAAPQTTQTPSTQPPPTSEPPTSEAPDAQVPRGRPRTTLPPPTAADSPIGDLPPARPDAEMFATRQGDAAERAPGLLLQVDLLSGAARHVPLPGVAHTLLAVDDEIVVGIGRRVLRVDPSSGDIVTLAEEVSEVAAAYEPTGIVAVTRGEDRLLARVLGADGVFRSAARLPNEAVVHGALGDLVIASMAGRVMALPRDEAGFSLGPGRVLAVGASGSANGSYGHLVRVQCEPSDCQITDTVFEVPAPGSGSGSGAAQVTQRHVPVPPLLAAVAPGFWSELGTLSPDGDRLALRLLHGPAGPSGIVVVDLAEGWSRHSPETGVDLGEMAWAPDSRYLLYTFDDDVMVWDTQAPEGARRSGRAHIGEALEQLILR